MDILLYNDKDDIVSIYTPNTLNFEKGNNITTKDENKKYKVVDIEKYRRLGNSEQVIMEVRKL